MGLTEAQSQAMVSWKPGDLILSIPADDRALGKVVLPIANGVDGLMCWHPDHVAIACDDPYICVIGFNNQVIKLDYLASEICMKPDQRARAEGFQATKLLSAIVSPTDTFIIKPTAENVIEYAHRGDCPSPHCREGYIRPDHPIWQCDGVRERMWNDEPEPRSLKVCPFCIGLDLAAEYDRYTSALASDLHIDEAWEIDLYRRLDERRAIFGLRASHLADCNVESAATDDSEDDETDQEQDPDQDQDRDPQTHETVEYEPPEYKADPAGPRAVRDIIKLIYCRIKEEGVLTAGSDCDICSACQEPFAARDFVSLLKCKRVLHWERIESSLKQKPACPSCRAPVEEKAAEVGMRDSSEIREATCGMCHRISRAYALLRQRVLSAP